MFTFGSDDIERRFYDLPDGLITTHFVHLAFGVECGLVTACG